jgi:DNA-binding CsgD family transcriptional regulator
MIADSAFDLPAAADRSAVRFTERQRLILCLVAEGLTNTETARRLHISPHTVAQHIAEMLRIVGARCRAELVARAYCDGTLPVGIWPPAEPTASSATARRNVAGMFLAQ